MNVKYTGWGVVAGLALALILIDVWHFRQTVLGYDFFVHGKTALAIARPGAEIPPHFLYHVLLLGVKTLLGLTLYQSTLGVMVAANLAVYILLLRVFYRNGIGLAWGGAWAFMLCFANPPQLMSLLQSGEKVYKLYSGYHYLNVFHNPTVILLKPVALALFIMVTNRNRKPDTGYVLLVAAAAIVCALIKPSYVMSAAPVAFLAWAWQWWRQKKNHPVLLSCWVSSTVILLGQFVLYAQFSDATEQGGRGIAFSPFTVMSAWSDHLFLKFLISLLFVLVAGWFHRSMLRDERFQFAAWTFAVSCVFTYLFAETGKEVYSGNFIWCSQIAIFMLFVSTVQHVASAVARSGLWVRQNLVPVCCWLLYLAGGVVWIARGGGFNVFV